MNTPESKPGRPLADEMPASGHIHLRVTMERKNWYVRMARLHNLTLAEWMQRVCDAESGYPPKSQLVCETIGVGRNQQIAPANPGSERTTQTK